jgi:hypothetical protein
MVDGSMMNDVIPLVDDYREHYVEVELS